MTNEELEQKVKDLEKEAKNMTPEERNDSVSTITEDYYKARGKMPNTGYLTRLSNVILIDELSDRTPDKITKNEYPFLSERQEEKRVKRELSLEDDTINFLNMKERKKMPSAFKKRTRNKED
ncbi:MULTISPECIES: hypothetical protein [unclassified Exiguobacterium]|uniref:hypothetical protein n=1 Tax=unclassified Exiguobacterium TaxID=2644629 RepID=UPI001BEA57BA|nr:MULTISPECIES: hypothetical protein [unclassified Exiguobacterium]